MSGAAPRRWASAQDCVEALIEQVGRELRVAVPLGLGKPNTLLNALYRRAVDDPSVRLHLYTALTLAPPPVGQGLQARLAGPIQARLFEGYESLDYWEALRGDALPANIRVTEFFFQPATLLGRAQAQQDYLCSNYTHVGRDLRAAQINVFMQLVAPHPDTGSAEQVSLSSNPDVTLEMLPYIRQRRADGLPVAVLGQVCDALPYMGRDAVVTVDQFDGLFEGEAAQYRLFGTPAAPVSAADHAIGLQVSALLRDGGTLQIGIGALSDAIAWSAGLRENDNNRYRQAIAAMPGLPDTLVEQLGGRAPFRAGLYGCTEMLVEAYLHLQRVGVIKRRVYPHAGLQRLLDDGRIGVRPDEAMLDALVDASLVGNPLSRDDVHWLREAGIFRADVEWAAGTLQREGLPGIEADLSREENLQAIADHCLGSELRDATLIHGGFFLGGEGFYERLRALPPAERDLICMTGVAQINQLNGNEPLRVAQRRHARFVNTGLKVTLMGSVVSDGLESGQVLSGVGGQYNFVAQAHALPEARSILCIRATRGQGEALESNVVWAYGHVTIPRHLRDIVATEYGVADLRGATDSQVIARLLDIADSRFQPALLKQAVAAGKLPDTHEISPWARDNRPEALGQRLAAVGAGGFPAFPFGSELSAEEITLMRALRGFQALDRWGRARSLLRHAGVFRRPPAAHGALLSRMGLHKPRGWRERLQAGIVSVALLEAGAESQA